MSRPVKRGADGGGVGLGIDLPYQTLSPHSLQLTEEERSDLKTFMESLTDTTYRRESDTR